MKKLVPHKDVVSQEVQGEVVLLHLGTEQYYGLDGPGILVWQLLAEGQPRDEILVALKNRYQAVPESTLATDLDELLSDLERSGLVEQG